MTDPRWDRPCSLMGCPLPWRPHHHHWLLGHLSHQACRCPEAGQPGTRLTR